MTYSELVESLTSITEVEHNGCTCDEYKYNVELLENVFLINPRVKSIFEQVDNSTSFYKLVPYLKKMLKGDAIDFFYAMKLGYYIENVPMQLFYIVTKALSNDDAKLNPNYYLCGATALLSKFAGLGYPTSNGVITFKDVVENVINQPVRLLSNSLPKVKQNSCYEVWIPNVNKVALIPNDIAKMISYEDCRLLTYTNDGICLYDIPIRTFGDRLGITINDFDLRECV